MCAGRCLGGHCGAVWRMVTGTLRTLERNQAEAATLQTSAHCLASRYNIRDTNGISRQDGDGDSEDTREEPSRGCYTADHCTLPRVTIQHQGY